MYSKCSTLASVFILGASLAVAPDAEALSIVAGTTATLYQGAQPGINNNSTSDILDWIQGQFSPDLVEYYKATPGQGEANSMSAYYETTFDSSSDASAATIVNTGSQSIVSNQTTPAYLLVKDGNHLPHWYFYNLTSLGWNGTETLQLSNFWPNGGAISHVSLFGNATRSTTTQSTPDGGSTVFLMGAALCGLSGVRRFLRRK